MNTVQWESDKDIYLFFRDQWAEVGFVVELSPISGGVLQEIFQNPLAGDTVAVSRPIRGDNINPIDVIYQYLGEGCSTYMTGAKRPMEWASLLEQAAHPLLFLLS